jgi:hypothetical protein
VALQVLERNYDKTVQVRAPNGKVTLGEASAGKVWVRRNGAETKASKKR